MSTSIELLVSVISWQRLLKSSVNGLQLQVQCNNFGWLSKNARSWLHYTVNTMTKDPQTFSFRKMSTTHSRENITRSMRVRQGRGDQAHILISFLKSYNLRNVKYYFVRVLSIIAVSIISQYFCSIRTLNVKR